MSSSKNRIRNAFYMIILVLLLGAQMKKPMAVVLLLLLCFPVRLIFWLFFAAVIGRKAAQILGQEVRRARQRLQQAR